MKIFSFPILKSFRFMLMTIILTAAGLPVLLFSYPLIEKIYQITTESAVNELELRAENISNDLTHEMELIASRLLTLAENSDIITGSYSMLHIGRASHNMARFEERNSLVSAVYLIDSLPSVMEAVPPSIEVLDLPSEVDNILGDLFKKQEQAEAVQSRYQFVAFEDQEFFDRSFNLISEEKRMRITRPFRTSHGIAVFVPLVRKIGDGEGIKEITGAVIAIVPFEYLIAHASSGLNSPTALDFQQEGDQTVFRTKRVPTENSENYISSRALFRLISSDLKKQKKNRGSEETLEEIRYEVLLSEPSRIRFAEVNTALERLITWVFIALTVLLICTYIIAQWLVSPLSNMRKIVRQYAAGNYRSPQKRIFFLEFSKTVTVLEDMGKKILRQLTDLQETNKAYARFVPNDFLDHLDKDSILDMELGDHVERKMSILFSDIRDFTTLSESMAPEENFRFVNSILSRIGPIIRNHSGFIDKYIGDAIMALFDKTADNAISAGIAMQYALAEYNQQRAVSDTSPIRIGIGINTGDLMLGTIGEHDRMEGTVISDAVNLASRLEGLTKIYGASLLISEQTFCSLVNPDQFNIRAVDVVAVKGKSQPVRVFEVIDGEPPERREKKIQTKALFERAVSLYRNMEFQQTAEIMQEVLSQHLEDKAAQVYIERCEKNIQAGVSKHWTGVTQLCEK